MMCLSILLVVSLIVAEFFLRKFDVLHMMYNQMLRFKDRQLVCFNQFDVTGNYEVTASAFMMTRLTVILVISYIWQFCVLESYTFTDSQFPHNLCYDGSAYQCFQTPLAWDSFLRAKDMHAIDCSKGDAGFVPISPTFGVSCFRIISQNAAIWLQSLAVANALGLLMTRTYEVLAWVSFESVACLVSVTALGVLVVIAVIAATVMGYFSSVANSWIGFMAMSICPFMLYAVRSLAVEVRKIKNSQMRRIQLQTKDDFDKIATDFSSVSSIGESAVSFQEDILRKRSRFSNPG